MSTLSLASLAFNEFSFTYQKKKKNCSLELVIGDPFPQRVSDSAEVGFFVWEVVWGKL